MVVTEGRNDLVLTCKRSEMGDSLGGVGKTSSSSSSKSKPSSFGPGRCLFIILPVAVALPARESQLKLWDFFMLQAPVSLLAVDDVIDVCRCVISWVSYFPKKYQNPVKGHETY